jgi:hypothetical protein
VLLRRSRQDPREPVALGREDLERRDPFGRPTRLDLREMAVEALVGALVDAAGVTIIRVPDAKRDHRPSQAPIGVLDQAKDKAEWRV